MFGIAFVIQIVMEDRFVDDFVGCWMLFVVQHAELSGNHEMLVQKHQNILGGRRILRYIH